MTNLQVTPLMRSRGKRPHTALTAVVLAAGALSMTLPGAVVHAENGKTYPAGANCRYPSANKPSNFRHNPDGVFNSTTAFLVVLCPVLKDEVSSTAGLNSVYVWYYQPKGYTPLYCDLYSYTADSSYGFKKSRQDTLLTPGRRQFTFDKTANYSSGNYSMACALPPGGILYSYQVNEH